MNATFQRVAASCGLRLSYYGTAAMITLAFLALVVTEYRTPSPLYILLATAILPSLLRTMFFPKSKEKRENTGFPLFCQKYHYHPDSYKAMSLAYFLVFVLLAAWYISYHTGTGTDTPDFIALLPALIAAISLLTRLLGVIGFRLYFHFFPLKAMR